MVFYLNYLFHFNNIYIYIIIFIFIIFILNIIGINLCVNMIEELLQYPDIVGFHFYTLNLENSVMKILQEVKALESITTRRYLY